MKDGLVYVAKRPEDALTPENIMETFSMKACLRGTRGPS